MPAPNHRNRPFSTDLCPGGSRAMSNPHHDNCHRRAGRAPSPHALRTPHTHPVTHAALHVLCHIRLPGSPVQQLKREAPAQPQKELLQTQHTHNPSPLDPLCEQDRGGSARPHAQTANCFLFPVANNLQW